MRLFLAVLALIGCFAVACGSGEEAPRQTGTATSERVERQATVAEEEAAPAVQETIEAEETQQVQQMEQEQAVQQAQQSVAEVEEQQQIQQAQEEVEEEQTYELPVEIVGVHKGVRSERHVLGEPDAPVEIRYFGDFT